MSDIAPGAAWINVGETGEVTFTDRAPDVEVPTLNIDSSGFQIVPGQVQEMRATLFQRLAESQIHEFPRVIGTVRMHVHTDDPDGFFLGDSNLVLEESNWEDNWNAQVADYGPVLDDGSDELVEWLQSRDGCKWSQAKHKVVKHHALIEEHDDSHPLDGAEKPMWDNSMYSCDFSKQIVCSR